MAHHSEKQFDHTYFIHNMKIDGSYVYIEIFSKRNLHALQNTIFLIF